MKTLILCAAMIFLLVAVQPLALGRNIYGYVDVVDIEPMDNAQWELRDGKQPRYPKELVTKGVMGCAIASFGINDSGRTENVKVVSTAPTEELARPVKKMMNQVRWQPVEEGGQPGEEQRVMRLNFCMSQVSGEEAGALCARISKLPCE